MNERIKLTIEPAQKRIAEQMKKDGICVDCLSAEDIVEIFRLQAKNDVSEDKPILKDSLFLYYPDRMFFSFNYSIADEERLGKTLDLKLSGNVRNGSDSRLSNEEHILIYPDTQKMKKRVFKSFEKKDSLTVPDFFESMIKDALSDVLHLDTFIKMKLTGIKIGFVAIDKKVINENK